MNSKKDDSLHLGHRERMRERVLRDGIDGLQDHESLEVLLYPVVPRKDTNKLAHRLIRHFGSLSGVYDAPVGELLKIDGIGMSAAFAISTLTGHYRKYAQSRTQKSAVLDNKQRVIEFMHSHFKGRTSEAAFMLTLDAGFRQALCVELGHGSFDHVDISPHNISDIISRRRCRYAVLAHNHTSDIALYSQTDVVTTHRIQRLLHHYGVTLLDHLVFDERDYVSMKQSNVLLNEDELARGIW